MLIYTHVDAHVSYGSTGKPACVCVFLEDVSHQPLLFPALPTIIWCHSHSTSIYCSHFFFFPLIFFLKASVLFLSISLSHPHPITGDENEYPKSCTASGDFLPDVQPKVRVCSIKKRSLINTAPIYPKAPLMTLLMPGSLEARWPPL